MKISQLLETLKPSEYRPFVKGWDKTRWAELFNNKYRLLIPLSKSTTPNREVIRTLEALGCEVTPESYLKNEALKIKRIVRKKQALGSNIADKKEPSEDNVTIKKRPVAISTILNDPSNNVSIGIKTLYKEDPFRMIAVISRHPYDIASMSTRRSWISCMNLHHGGSAHYIPLEIKAGTIIAYLVYATDININNPISRIAIKPFVNTIGNHEIALGIQSQSTWMIYGNPVPEFVKVISDWVDNVNNSKNLSGIFKLDPSVYDDTRGGEDHRVINGSDTNWLKWYQQSKIKFRDIPQAVKLKHPEICVAAVKQNGNALYHVPEEMKLKHPEICLAAVKQNGKALIDVPEEMLENNPKICMAAVKETGEALVFVPIEIRLTHPRMCLVAVEKYGKAFWDVPTEISLTHPEIYLDICVAAVKQDGEILSDVPPEIRDEVARLVSQTTESVDRMKKLAGI